MKIHEFQAKGLFADYDIPVPEGRVVTSPEEAQAAAEGFGGVVAVKAQVHAGGRGKAGGVKIAKSPDEAREAAEAILGMEIKGSTVHQVLVERGSDIAREAYLGLVTDRAEKSISFICSAAGGVDIEEVAEKEPEKILRIHSFSREFPEAEAAGVAGQLFDDESKAEAVLDFMRKLYRLFVEKDCSLAEINPLVLTGSGEVIALDGKINIDDNGLFRQSDLEALRDMREENEKEIDARAKGLSYVELDGDIGCMVNGAGLAMATMDTIHYFGGEPANFLDVGGSSNPEKVVNAFNLILSKGNVKSILINIFGGITRCDDIASGILTSLERIKMDVPIVVRLAGTNSEEGLAMLENSPLHPASSLSEGVQKVIELSKEA